MSDQPCPVVAGISVQVPGPRGLAGMWHSLSSGRCTITRLTSRFADPDLYFDPKPGQSGRSYSFAAGQLEEIYRFDAGFFGIPPRSAGQIDPQQRLLLRTVWEAIEDAGLSPADLAGERTGVIVASSIVENLSLSYNDPTRVGSQFSLGNTLSSVPNRVSAFFDFRGPSYTVDTACSSGLYALHQAAGLLRRDELDTVIVAGANLQRSPGGFIGFAQARMLSLTGACYAFDARADGYVRGEAVVAVVLQRPEVARRMGARQRAELLATGVNSDGTSSQLTVPSASQQERLLDQALLHSGLDPDELSFFEAHGTGTAVGDPVEAGSIGRSVGQLRRDPLLIGSCKPNFGHSEPAAGLVGLAKVLLAFEHRQLPASLNFETPNPAIDFEGLNLEVNTRLRALDPAQPLTAALNAFGFGGTNATAFLRAADPALRRLVPGTAPVAGADTAPDWLLLSAASPASLARLSLAWAAQLETSGPGAWSQLAAAQGTRPAFPLRLAVPLTPQAPALLRAASDTEAPGGVFAGRAQLAQPRVVFAFPGNGVQTAGMGRSDYAASPLFRRQFDKVAAEFARQGGPDLHELRLDDDLAARLDQPLVAQSVLFGFQVALAGSLMEAGLMPEAVIGHSVGEIAALHLAGCFDLADAVHIIRSRSLAFETLRGSGGMAAVAASAEDVGTVLAGLGLPDLVIAAVNAPRSVTVAGSAGSLDRLARSSLNGRRLPMVRLKLTIPYHSPAVDPLYPRFMADLSGVRFRPPKLAVGASALGEMLPASGVSAAYLWRNARDTVNFEQALTALALPGPMVGVEISPAASLAGNLRDIARFRGLAIEHFLPAADISDAGPASPAADTSAGGDAWMRRLLAKAWSRGVPVPAARLTGPVSRPLPDLPPYPFDEQEYQISLSPDGLDAWGEVSRRRLTGLRAERASTLWMAELTPGWPAWLADHRVGGSVVVPATALAEMALGAADELWPEGALRLEDFDIVAPVVVEDPGVRLRTEVDPGTGVLRLAQRPRLVDAGWRDVARGVLRRTAAEEAPPLAPPGGNPLPLDGIYPALAAAGLAYGPLFRRLSSVQQLSAGEYWVHLDADQLRRAAVLDFTGLDAAFHSLGAVLAQSGLRSAGAAVDKTLVPVRFGALTLLRRGAEIRRVRLTITTRRPQSLVADLQLYDGDQAFIGSLTGVEFSAMRLSSGRDLPAGRSAVQRQRLRLPQAPVMLPPGWDAGGGAALTRLGYLGEPPGAGPLEPLMDTFRRGLVSSAAGAELPGLAALLGAAPDLAADLRAMMAAVAGSPAGAVAQFGYASRLLWQEALRLMAQLARDWPAGQRLNLHLIGLPVPDALRRIAALEGIDRLSLSQLDESAHSSLFRDLPGDLTPLIVQPGAPGSVDVQLDLSGRADPELPVPLLAPGGLWLALDMPALTGAALSGAEEAGACLWRPADLFPLRLRLHRAPPGPALPASGEVRRSGPERVAGASGEADLKAIPPVPAAEAEASTEGGAMDTARDAAPQAPPAELTFLIEAQDIASASAGLVAQVGPGVAAAEATHQLWLHSCDDEQDAVAGLAALLLRLRSCLAGPSLPLILIVEDRSATGVPFALLMEALGAAACTLANESAGARFGVIGLARGAGLPPADQLAPLVDLALTWQSVTLSPEGLTARVVRPVPPEPQTGPQILVQPDRGDLTSLSWQLAAPRDPGPGEVELEIAAAGLNFRDVMLARGLLPERLLDLGGSGYGLGMECAGIVRRVGPGVAAVRPGDAVMGLAPGAFANRAVVPAIALSPVPAGMALSSAAALPVAFLTAWYALKTVARLGPGDTVLIHGGAGGVGLAAIAIARQLGARVFATAGSADKQAIARAWGAEAVLSSRDLSFEPELRRLTAGRGVDVVLNSLAGEAMRRSVACLAPFGRFIELGKRDFLEGTQLDLRPFLHNLSYHGVDLDQVVAASPDSAASAMAALSQAFARGELPPLPVTTYPAADVPRAFADMLAARHSGKIVILPPGIGGAPPSGDALAAQTAAAPGKISGHWLILGGTGGLGLATARRLLSEGAEHVHLASRSGEVSIIEARLHPWAASEPRLSRHALDCSDAAALGALLAGLDARGVRISGVIHAAMVLRDRLIRDLDLTEIRSVLTSKLGVALALDKVLRSRAQQPDHVVFFSSIVAQIGNPGQLAYAAANAALDGLAAARRADGLPGLAIGWGPVAGAGYLARDTVASARLSHQTGLRLLGAEEMLHELMVALLRPGGPDYAFAALSWDSLADVLPALNQPAFARLVAAGRVRRQPQGEFIARLRSLSREAALTLLRTEISVILGKILHLPPEQIDPDKPLLRSGIDSLMAMELRLEVEQRFGCDLPVAVLNQDTSAARLAAGLLARLRDEDPAGGEAGE